MKSGSKKKSSKLGKFISRVYDVYFLRDHGHYGTDADHVPVIPGNDFTADGSQGNEAPLQRPEFNEINQGQVPIGE